MIVKEGGNIFKDEQGTPVTQRISKVDVDNTLAWLEKITDIPHKDFKLGSTGIKDTSGDLDVAVNQAEVDKVDLYNKLVAWKTKNHPDDDTRAWVAKSGISVHFKTPINGNPANGFVQTDLMFGNPDFMKFAYKGTGDGTIYKGAHRAIMIASLAKAQGMMWSPTRGLVNRETKEVMSTNPAEIAQKLLGPGTTGSDLDSVEAMNTAIKNRPDYEALTADVRDNFAKQGMPMPESRGIRAGLMLAEQRKDEGILSGIGKALQKGASAVKGGYAVGRDGNDPKAGIGANINKMGKTYQDAGGPKTTFGQVADKVTSVGQNLTGNTIKVKGKMKNGKEVVKPIPKVQLKKYLDAGWEKVVVGKDDDKIIFAHPKDGRKAKVLKVDKKQINLYTKAGWKIQKESKKQSNRPLSEAARIDHAEDLVYLQGSQGAMRALQSLRSMAKGGQGNITLKWDGSPAVVFGRNENGEFILTDKGGFLKVGGVERATSGEDLEQALLNRSGGIHKDKPDRIAFASNMKQAFGVFENATPTDFRGYFKGDLLYYNTPPVVNKNFVFKPQLVEYAVDVDSDLGKRIAKSTTGVVIHRIVDEQGQESPLKDFDIFQGNKLLVVPPVTIEEPAQVPNEEVERLAQIIKKDAADIDSLLDVNKLTQMKMKDFPKIIYKYMNSKVDTGLDNLGRDFTKWLSTSGVSRVKEQKIIEYVKQNMNAWTSLFEVITGIMKVKDSIIADLDSRPGTVKSTTAGKDGGEGYVLAHPEGDIKLVNRAGFTAANRAVER
mgnify:CR=1 FL=1